MFPSNMTNIERDARSAEARSILNSDVFKSIMADLENRAIASLKSSTIGDLTAQAAHARIKALDEILGELKSIANDSQIVKNRNNSRLK